MSAKMKTTKPMSKQAKKGHRRPCAASGGAGGGKRAGESEEANAARTGGVAGERGRGDGGEGQSASGRTDAQTPQNRACVHGKRGRARQAERPADASCANLGPFTEEPKCT